MNFKVIFAIIATIAFLSFMLYTNDISGYILAIFVAIKGFFAASKTKFIIFLKTLTFAKGLMLAIKRWLIDNVLSKWLNSNIFSHFKSAFDEMFAFYKNYSLRAKLKNLLMIIVPTAIVIAVSSYLNLFQSLAIYAELKVFVIGFFKVIWLFFGKIMFFLTTFFNTLVNSWLGPILEIFAISYLIELVEKLLGENNFITRFFTFLGKIYSKIFELLAKLFNIFGGKFTKKVSAYSRVYGMRVENWIQGKKIEQESVEFEELQKLEKEYLNAFANFKELDDKNKLYKKINSKSASNIKIIAYVPIDPLDSFKEDIFLLEGAASHNKHGVRKLKPESIDKSDFWVWNTSKNSVELESKCGNFYCQTLFPKSLVFIKTKEPKAIDDILANKKEFLEIN